jgi:hypothetical protein
LLKDISMGLRSGEYLGRYVGWAGVILDEAHFIKNASKRTSHCLKLLGVQGDAKAAPIGPSLVFLLTGTPMTNRTRDLFNLLRCVGHPAARSFLSFAKRYCGAYRNDYGWVTDGASNLDELNLLMKEVMLRRKKGEVLDLPPKIRSWVPVDLTDSPAAVKAIHGFLQWYRVTDPSKPNDTEFLSRLTKVRVALHKAKHDAVGDGVVACIFGWRKGAAAFAISSRRAAGSRGSRIIRSIYSTGISPPAATASRIALVDLLIAPGGRPAPGRLPPRGID